MNRTQCLSYHLGVFFWIQISYRKLLLSLLYCTLSIILAYTSTYTFASIPTLLFHERLPQGESGAWADHE